MYYELFKKDYTGNVELKKNYDVVYNLDPAFIVDF